MGAMVSIPLSDLDDIRNKNSALTDQIAELKKELLAAERQDPQERIEALVQTIMAALPIVAFATANLHPDTIRGWPYNQLAQLADLLEAAPGLPYSAQELALEFRSFAADAKRTEKGRAIDDTDTSCPLVEGCARGFGHTGQCADIEGTQLTQLTEDLPDG